MCRLRCGAGALKRIKESFYLFNYLLLIFKLFAIEAVEQQGKEEIEHHKVAHHERGEEDEEAALGAAGLLRAHAVPQRLDPLAA